ncbi:MAG TPA: amidohydrolase family protein [Candidatus Edwardsbacteria bacterium]|nr:amidohydrolase family protein [Candidatus Edwardsbacteria bacterium]
MKQKLYRVRADILDPVSADNCRWIKDGDLVFDRHGVIVHCGKRWDERGARTVAIDVPPRSVVIPGLVDCHSHLSQYHVRGRGGHALLDWLKNYVFREEARFRDRHYAQRTARSYFRKLLSRGVTCAAIYSNYPQGVAAAFCEAGRAGIRATIGYTMMDRGVPAALRLDPARALDTCRGLLAAAAAHPDRLRLSLNPRFALACSPALMRGIADFAAAHGLCIQTHLSENLDELSAVRRAFPRVRDYTTVYDHFGLLTERTLLAHCIHLADRERQLISDRGCGVVHCPSANMFLHSGRFPIELWRGYGRLGLGSDVGAGPSFSMFDVMRDGYFVNMQKLERLFFLATLGGARTLGLDKSIGSLARGKRADFVVLRIKEANRESGQDVLSDLIFKHDQRRILKVFVAGNEVYGGKD